MFDLALSDEEVAIDAAVRRLAHGPVAEAARDVEVKGSVPDELERKVRRLGFTAPVAEEFGGGGIPGTVTQLLALEALGHGDPGVAGTLALRDAAALVLGLSATAEQQRVWLTGIADGTRGAPVLALYERCGRGPDEYETSLTRENGGWRLRGEKIAVPLGGRPTHLLVIGTEEPGRLRGAIIPTDAPGVVIGPAPEQGYLAMSAAGLVTTGFDVLVAEECVIGEVPRNLSVAAARTRLLMAAVALGGAERAREYATHYATERTAFGQPIIDFQGVSFPLVENQIQIDAARLGLWEVAARLDAGEDGAAAAVSRVVNECHEASTTATRDAIQTLGGHGFLADHPLERWYRCAALLSVLDCDPLHTRFSPAV